MLQSQMIYAAYDSLIQVFFFINTNFYSNKDLSFFHLC